MIGMNGFGIEALARCIATSFLHSLLLFICITFFFDACVFGLQNREYEEMACF